MKRLKHIINAVIWAVVALYFGIIILTHIPPVQKAIGAQLSESLSRKLGTRVSVGRVDLGFLNRIIIDDVSILDQQGKRMILATRVSTKFDYPELLKGRIAVSSAQLFGLQALLYREKASSKPNFQFILDSLASKDTTTKSRLDLAINSLIIRNGHVSYDQLDVPAIASQFNPKHLHIHGISAHFIINALTNDSLNLNVKKIALKDMSGLNVNSLAFKLVANRNEADLKDFRLILPHTELILGDTHATYRMTGGKLEMPSLTYEGSIDNSTITPCDLACFAGFLNSFRNSILINSNFSGTSTTLLVKRLTVASDNRSINLNAYGAVSNWQSTPRWTATVNHLTLKESGIKFIADNLGQKFNIPIEVTRLGDINYRGQVGGLGADINAAGTLRTEAGNASLTFRKTHRNFNGHIETSGINLKRILADDHFGNIATQINVEGTFTGQKIPDLRAKGIVSQFDYNSYSYRNLYVNGTYRQERFDGIIGMDDPNGKIDIAGTFSTNRKAPSARITATADHLNPSALKISDRWPGAAFSMNATADFTGRDINTAEGDIEIRDFTMKSAKNDYHLTSMHVHTGKAAEDHFLSMQSDFGDLYVRGRYDYTTLLQSFTNLVRSRFPALGLPSSPRSLKNNFSINATINRSDWLQQLLDLPFELSQPLHVEGTLDDNHREVNMTLLLPDFTYDGKHIAEGAIRLTTPDDSLKADARAKLVSGNGSKASYHIKASAIANMLNTDLSFNTRSAGNKLQGQLKVDTRFFKDDKGKMAFHSDILPSELMVGDTAWTVHPSHITYSRDHLDINHFAIDHNHQHLIVSGTASNSHEDSLYIDLEGIDVSYVLHLVNFHAVDFSGLATGRAYIIGAFRKPEAWAKLTVDQFRFEGGRMGTLLADVNLNSKEEQIDISAVAKDDPGETLINGYVSPQRNYIDLLFDANKTRLEMVEGFCSSFMRNVSARGSGELRLYGPLSNMNLVGTIVADGNLSISSLNTDYTLRNDTIRFIPDEIEFRRDTIYDAKGNTGILEGNIHHEHLTNLSYDIGINARNLLSYDFRELGDDTFYGTIFATGRCDIRGRSGEVTIDVDATPGRGSQFVYNASTPDAITDNMFIRWRDRDSIQFVQSLPWKDYITKSAPAADGKSLPDIPTDIHLNFLIHCTPDLTVKLLMDQQSGDYISLNGNGVVRAAYFNKGSFDMFGNYVVDHGLYKLSIQNAIKKDFQFAQGGTITFGGNPYDAVLNLKAQYAVSGVSLSDLHLGRSFSSNNIPVNCMMNISGTPNSPKVDFSLDLPTLGADAKQMIYSLINSEEEMNQQVLYLLTIGKFYSQGNNNADIEASQSNTSLAMQSLLSGTVSQQLNNVLSSITNNTNWNFGANISTGDEGWNNAEYEGLLNGRLLNNRLLINGQFGYRDNPNATTSFIGDFDIRYLLSPNGNFSIKVYNQTNDRYFTRNSLTTQGLGLIIKKDFNGLRDLLRFPFKNQKKKKLPSQTKDAKKHEPKTGL